MSLSPNAHKLLLHILSNLNTSKDRKNFFLYYKKIHDDLGWKMNGNSWGLSLANWGLQEVAEWIRDNKYPAITSLIVDQQDMMPGGGLYPLYGRPHNDIRWWITQVEDVKKYDWSELEISLKSARKISPDPKPQTKDHDQAEVVASTNDTESDANTYLLVWSPKTWAWDTFEEEYQSFKKIGTFIRPWGCGRRKNIKKGSRIFFIKLGGTFPTGIMGSGYAASDTYQADHWNNEPGEIANYIDVSFDVLLHPEREAECFISTETLDGLKDKGIMQEWHPMQSGIDIKPLALAFLQETWLKTQTKVIQTEYIEGTPTEKLLKSYERSPEARVQAIKAHGVQCKVCEMKFDERYGQIGEGFIHIHHIIPVAQRKAEYRINPLTDLVPVCPNCHAMLHRSDPPLSIDELKKKLK